MSIDPNRIILKRSIITGYPIHCHKRTATVRYMFTNPEDVIVFLRLLTLSILNQLN